MELDMLGKTYDPKAATLIPIKKQNGLLNNSSTALFALISGMAMQSLTSPKSSSAPVNAKDIEPTIGRGGNPPKTRYFSSKVNIKPIIIKEIDEPTYKQQLKDPFFKVAILEPETPLEDADKKLPGLKAFLSV